MTTPIRLDFEPFNPHNYVKEFVDVLLPSGRIVYNCWPNAGVIVATNSTGKVYTADEIVGVRPARKPFQ